MGSYGSVSSGILASSGQMTLGIMSKVMKDWREEKYKHNNMQPHSYGWVLYGVEGGGG